jgi:UDP-GlcNAc:undecaprenyl-phosphate/decaprenyl-phosphate GlcNAc-1-phosphate transferase
MTELLVYFALGLSGSLALTPVCRSLAHRFGYVAKPSQERWHKKPTALFGGVAIVIPTLVVGASLAAAAWAGDADQRLWQLLVCVAAIAVCGFADDLLALKPSTKLVAQVAVASALLFFGFRLHWTESLLLDSMFTLFWIVGITNALNLLDNMDGLCSGTALIAGAFILAGAFSDGGITPSVLYLAALLGATAGFLVYNFNPASIFMGDTGSLFLGLNLSALTLIDLGAGDGATNVISVVAGPVLLLLIPIFDTTLVTTMRLLSGRRPSQGGRDHSSHRLVALGLPERTAVAVLWTLAACAGATCLLLRSGQQSWAGVLAIGFLIAMIIFAVYLARIRVYEDSDAQAVISRGAATPLLAEILYKRRVGEVLLDLCLIPLAYYSAYRLRFEGIDLAIHFEYFVQSLPVVLAAQLVSLFAVGAYRGTWRYFGIMDAVTFARGVAIGTIAAVVIIVYVYHFESYSRAVFVIYAALLLLFLTASRGSFRLLGEFVHRRRVAGHRCVIYGASGASVALIREAFDHRPLRILGFVDDDPTQVNVTVAGYRVIGDFAHLLSLVRRGDVDFVVVNVRVADVARLQLLEAECAAHDVELVTLQLDLKRFTLAS